MPEPPDSAPAPIDSPITLDDCPTYLKQIIANIIRGFKETGELPAMLIAVKGGEFTCLPVGPFMEDRGRKERLAHLMEQLAGNKGCEAVCLVSEIWAVPSNHENKQRVKRIALDGDLHRHPLRREMLSINYNAPGITISVYAKIKRKQSKLHGWIFDPKPAAEYAAMSKKMGMPQGRFDNIFAKVGK